MQEMQKLNFDLARAYFQVVRELAFNIHALRVNCDEAVSQGNQSLISELSLAWLTCEFSVITIGRRAESHQRCVEDSEFSDKYWSSITFN